MKRQDQPPGYVKGKTSGRTQGNNQDRRTNKPPGAVRIIGGQWRGRRVPVPDIAGLRPSGDRCRETLFNWLQPFVQNAQCIDLFAGTGVLGFEAVSRGATKAVLVEKSRIAASALRQSAQLLDAVRLEVVEGDALQWLAQQAPASVDVVFVDPPFSLDLAEAVMKALQQSRVVRPGGLVYVESAAPDAGPLVGPGWELLKEKRLGDVRMQLFRSSSGALENVPPNALADDLASVLPT